MNAKIIAIAIVVVLVVFYRVLLTTAFGSISKETLTKPRVSSDGSTETPEDLRIDEGMPKVCWKDSRRQERPGWNPGVPIQYIHIPKAGGTTIQESLLPWAKSRNYHTYLHDGDHDGVWKCPGMVDRGVLLGHRGFGFCDRMLKKFGAKAFFIVALREPVSRFRSLFDYFLDNDYPSFAEYHRMWKGKELSDLVIEAASILKMNLPKTDPRMRSPIRFLQLARQQTNFMCGWDCVSLKPSNVTMSQKLERALDNLRRTDIVVVMEHLDDLIAQLRYHTYLVPANINKFPMENTHKGKKSVLTPEASKIVAEWSKRDTVLYDIAKLRHQELTEHAKRCLNEEKYPGNKADDEGEEEENES